MVRWSLTVILFVATSIAVAMVYHRWQAVESSRDGQASFASQDNLIEQINEVVEKSEDVQSRLSDPGLTGSHEAFRCDCTVAGVDSPAFQFENTDECGPNRDYFQNQFEKFPPIFREARSRSSADFPRICMTFIMRRQFPKAEAEPKSYFAHCDSEEGAPIPGNYKPCVTEYYVNVVYNTFADVTSCLNLPQKDFLPKVFVESGFHTNALGAGFDSGVGQLTGAALEHANSQFGSYKNKILKSDQPACQRLKPFVKKLQRVPVSKEIGISNRCSIMSPPDNPLKNLLYVAIKYEQDSHAVAFYLQKYKINEMMKKAGVQKHEAEQLNHMMTTLGFNAGASSAVIYLKNFLQYRIELASQGRGPEVTDKDFDFNEDIETFKGKLPEEVAGKVISFPAYLAIYQNSGAKGYLTSVASHARILNSNFKEGTCVADSYLSLSY